MAEKHGRQTNAPSISQLFPPRTMNCGNYDSLLFFCYAVFLLLFFFIFFLSKVWLWPRPSWSSWNCLRLCWPSHQAGSQNCRFSRTDGGKEARTRESLLCGGSNRQKITQSTGGVTIIHLFLEANCTEYSGVSSPQD